MESNTITVIRTTIRSRAESLQWGWRYFMQEMPLMMTSLLIEFSLSIWSAVCSMQCAVCSLQMSYTVWDQGNDMISMIQLQKAILEKNFAIIFWLHVTSCLLVTLTFYYYVCQSLLQNKLWFQLVKIFVFFDFIDTSIHVPRFATPLIQRPHKIFPCHGKYFSRHKQQKKLTLCEPASASEKFVVQDTAQNSRVGKIAPITVSHIHVQCQNFKCIWDCLECNDQIHIHAHPYLRFQSFH